MVILNGTNSMPYASDVSELNKSAFGKNCDLCCGERLLLRVDATNSTATISDGMFCFSGKIGRVTSAETIEYIPPAQDYFKKIIIGVLYTKNKSGIERFEIVHYESAIAETASSAGALAVNLPSDEITASTISAFFPLWSFVAASTSYEKRTRLFEYGDIVADLKTSVKSCETCAQDALNEATEAFEELENFVETLSNDLEDFKDDIANILQTEKTTIAEIGNGIEKLAECFEIISDDTFLIHLGTDKLFQFRGSPAECAYLGFVSGNRKKSIRLSYGEFKVGG